MRICLIFVAAVLAGSAPTAQAQPGSGPDAQPQPDYFRSDETTADDVLFRIDRERTAGDWYLVGGLAGGALVMTGVSLLFHVSANGAASDVEADRFTGRTWTDDLQSRYDDSVRNGRIATIGYAIAGGLAVGTIVAFLLTDPGSELVRRPKTTPEPYVVPTQGGLMLGQEFVF